MTRPLNKILRPALLIMLSACLPVAGAPEQQPDSERRQQLRQILAEDCSVCHGESLQGDLGPSLTTQSLAGKNEDELVNTILEGHDETAMPPWWAMLEEHEARWLVRFIRSGRLKDK